MIENHEEKDVLQSMNCSLILTEHFLGAYLSAKKQIITQKQVQWEKLP